MSLIARSKKVLQVYNSRLWFEEAEANTAEVQ